MAANEHATLRSSLLHVLAAAWWSVGDVDRAARCVGAGDALAPRSTDPWVGVTARRLADARLDAELARQARIAAADPEVAIASVLASTGD
jgi:hypothetical protein